MLALSAALEAAQDPATHLIWVLEGEAGAFQEPDWVRLEPPLGGAVMFVHRERQQLARRSGGLADDTSKG